MALERYIKVSISNTSQEPVRVALLPSYLAEKKYVLENGKIKQVASAEALQKAGYAVDFVAIQDGKQELGELSVEISSQKGYASFANFLAYIKNNPTFLKQLTIISDTAVAPVVPDNPDIITYNYSAVVQGGGGTITPGSGTIAEGLSQEFTLTPKPGYIIDKLLDNNIDKTNKIMAKKYIIENVKEEHDIVATFKKKEYNVHIKKVDPNIGVVQPVGNIKVIHGGSIDLQIAAKAGYKLKSIHILKASEEPIPVDISLVVNYRYTLSNITQNLGVAISFEPIRYNFKAKTEGGNGTISPTEGSIEHEKNQEFIITPNDGYQVNAITDNGTDVTNKLIAV